MYPLMILQQANRKEKMMREKYESLPLTSLRDIAKARHLKGVSTMKKADIIELMLEEDEKDKVISE